MDKLTPLQRARLEVETALSLLTPDVAEAVVGADAEGFGELIAGSKSVIGLMWAMLKQQGARETPATLKVVAQAIVMEAQIVNYAYAMGKRARDDSADGA